jgi:hypothetical protein
MILLSNAKGILALLLRPFGFFPPKNYKNYLAFQSFDVDSDSNKNIEIQFSPYT